MSKIFGSFQTFDDPELIKAQEQAKKFCRDMASGNQPARWITFLGPSGVGKTFLVRKVTFFFSRYLEALQDERNSDSERWTRRGGFKRWIEVVNDFLTGDYSAMPQLCSDWYVALDDIGVEYERNKALAVSKLYHILTKREGLFTAITANIPLDQIGECLDVRIMSRLLRNGSAVVNVDTKDFNDR